MEAQKDFSWTFLQILRNLMTNPRSLQAGIIIFAGLFLADLLFRSFFKTFSDFLEGGDTEVLPLCTRVDHQTNGRDGNGCASQFDPELQCIAALIHDHWISLHSFNFVFHKNRDGDRATFWKHSTSLSETSFNWTNRRSSSQKKT